jgi:hypothetical protein
VAGGVLAGLGLAFGLFVAYTLVGSNFHTVVPGRVYRCAQPSGPGLEELIRTHGIRTVINLRGCCDPEPWYLEQCRVTNRLNIDQEDLGFSAGRLPSPQALRQLIEVLDRSPYPVVFHCHRGADRSGMASAIALLLQTDTPLAEARRQLGPRYGHLPLGKTAHLDRFFDLYSEWLAGQGRAHAPEAFRRWAEHDYCPGECRCRIELLESWPRPARVPKGRPFPVRVRCTNTSVKPWRLRPGTGAGVHAVFNVLDDLDAVVATGRSGLFHATVPAGAGIDLTLAVPALDRPGPYRLRVDMVDEQHAFFLQTGSEPLVWELEVP